MNSIGYADEIVAEYLLFRGFHKALQTFNSEKSADRTKAFQVNRLVEELMSHVTDCNLTQVLYLWNFLDDMFFSRLSSTMKATAAKLEHALKQYYLVHAVMAGKLERVREFFEVCHVEMTRDRAWEHWFALPYVRTPEEDPRFAVHFSKQWLDTFVVSLSNYLAAVFQSLQLPAILNFNTARLRSRRLEAQVASLKQENARMEAHISRLQLRQQQLRRASGDADGGGGGGSNDRLQQRQRQQQQQQQQQQQAPGQWNDVRKQMPIVGGEYRRSAARPFPIDSSATATATTAATAGIGGADGDGNSEGGRSSSVSVSAGSGEDDSGAAVVADMKDTPGGSLSERERREQQRLASEEQALVGAASLGSLDGILMDGTRANAGPNGATRGGGGGGGVNAMRSPTPVNTSAVYQVFSGHNAPITQCKFSPSGMQIASASSDGIVRVWSPEREVHQGATMYCFAEVLALEWETVGNQLLYCGTADRKIKLFNCSAAGQMKSIAGVQESAAFPRIVDISCSPRDATFISAATCAFAPAPVAAAAALPSTSTAPSPSVSASASSTTVGGGGGGGAAVAPAASPVATAVGSVLLWDIRTLAVQQSIEIPLGVAVTSVSFNHNGSLFVSSATDGRVRIFDTRTATPIMEWHAHAGEAVGAQFDPNETHIVTVGADGKMYKWSAHHVKAPVVEFNFGGNFAAAGGGGGGGGGSALAASGDDVVGGASAASSSGSGSPTVSSSGGGSGGGAAVSTFATKCDMAFDRAGDHVLVGRGPNNTALVYNLSLPDAVMAIEGHMQPVTCVDWCGNYCLTGSADQTVYAHKMQIRR